MELKDLEIFKEVARQQNISKTAVKFNYVQSNITNRLIKLETEVGCELLIRTNKGVQLTNEGKIFLDYTNKVLQLNKELHLELHGENAIREIKIGATDITTSSRLPAILSAFKEAYPTVDISLQIASTEQLVKSVLQHDLDGAFITSAIKHPELHYQKVADEEVVIICSKNHPPIVELADIQHEMMLIFSKGCTYRGLTEAWLRDEKILMKTMELSTTESMINFVKAGLGVALLSKQIVEQANHDHLLSYYAIPSKYTHAETGFITHKHIGIAKGLLEIIMKM